MTIIYVGTNPLLSGLYSSGLCTEYGNRVLLGGVIHLSN